MRPVVAGAVALILVSVLLASVDRVGAATIDVAYGVVEAAQDGQCSLIEALENANGDTVHADCTGGDAGVDTVVLATGSIYTLSVIHNESDWPGGFNGLPSVTTPIVLLGNGATIERSTASDTPEFRLLHVDYAGDLTIEELTLRHGRSSEGGGIANLGTLAIREVILNGNAGGGVFNDGIASIHDSWVGQTVSGNGIDNIGTITVVNSMATSNYGNGIRCTDGTQTVINSTSSSNLRSGLSSDGCSTVVINSTLNGNARLGIFIDDSYPFIANSIIAGSGVVDCRFGKGGPVFDGVNLIEDGSCGCVEPSCISGDPLLGELTDNGGSTPTHALLAGSIAIDKADDAQCPEEDQRGVARGIDAEGDGTDEELDGGCDIGAFEAGGFISIELKVDRETLFSDGNGILEPDERVNVAPSWQNGATSPRALSGKASDFTGPVGATYDLVAEDADYGDLGPGETASCQSTETCYQMEVVPGSVERPATHWDAEFEETLSDDTGRTWNLHIGESFSDVPRSSLFYSSVETLLHNGVTAGCSASEYCPEGASSRAQMPIFLLKAWGGPGYVPRACEEGDEMFADVPFDNPFCPWIQELARRNVTSGCADDAYCPSDPVTRDQLAVFLLRILEGDEYSPAGCSGVFADVPCPSVFADWIEDLHERGITSGCGTNPLEYCPDSSVTRGQVSTFLTRTFNLTLYGP